MKPLTAVKVQRGAVVNEWISSESQSTVDGLNAFAARQKERLERMQAQATETARKVKSIGAKR